MKLDLKSEHWFAVHMVHECKVRVAQIVGRFENNTIVSIDATADWRYISNVPSPWCNVRRYVTICNKRHCATTGKGFLSVFSGN